MEEGILELDKMLQDVITYPGYIFTLHYPHSALIFHFYAHCFIAPRWLPCLQKLHLCSTSKKV